MFPFDDVIMSLIKISYGCDNRIHSQTYTVHPLKFGKGEVISSHTAVDMITYPFMSQ